MPTQGGRRTYAEDVRCGGGPQRRIVSTMMNSNHDMARALVRAHQRDLEREAASRRFARRARRDQQRGS